MIYIEYTISLTPSFENELESIYRYLRFELNVPSVAKDFYNSIIKKVYSLKHYPERYSKIFGFKSKDKNLRKLPIKNYIIIYEVDNNTRSSLSTTYFSWFSKLFKFHIKIYINFSISL